MFDKYLAYIKDNPKGYWFKRKCYGWGWVPVRWQGWLVVLSSLFFVFGGIYVGQIDDAPGAALLGGLLMVGYICVFGYWKGEKPRWQWGIESLSKDKHEK